jgi:hypothetical protein
MRVIIGGDGAMLIVSSAKSRIFSEQKILAFSKPGMNANDSWG